MASGCLLKTTGCEPKDRALRRGASLDRREAGSLREQGCTILEFLMYPYYELILPHRLGKRGA